MSKVSTLSVNLLLEQVYLEGQVHMMYEEILKEDEPKDPESESMVKQVLADLKLNADFMFTFGVGIAGFVGPVNELLTNKGVHVTKYDVTLLVITALYVLLTKSKRDIDVLIAKVKEHKLDSELKKVIKFVNGTLGLFKIIGNKVGVTVTTLVDVLAFTFMSVPVLNLIKSLAAEKGYNIDNIEQLFAGLTLSAGAYLLKNVLKKRIKEPEEDFGWAEEIIKPYQDIEVPKKPKGKSLYELIEYIFKGSRFYIVKIKTANTTIYELNDDTGTYADFRKENFTIKNIRETLSNDIKDLQRDPQNAYILQQYIELYERLKPVLFKGKSYEKKKPK